MTEEELCIVKTLKGATMPDATKYTDAAATERQSAGWPDLTPAESEPQDAEAQTDQASNLDAGGDGDV